jgi:tRNA pseudouridine38-40 synthase
MRYQIRLSYNGSAFCGGQIQNDAVSVRCTIEAALSKLLGHPVQITGAGRTDTSVNAINYIAHFEIPSELSPARDFQAE